ncbi:MAG: three-Cys-motif partner protein TcmP [Thermoguttaceae bacterium]|jgi:three-Cys-motif partner protein|nr:three-Cys-motif partner protein TcmP [Thermoguttaceae bacterium]
MSSFFDQSTDQSRVKAAIVANYFWAWAKVIISVAKKGRDRRIAYIDLFAGPGRYTDGTLSTPLLILERAIADPDLREMLVTVFNDCNSDHSRTLETAIAALPGIETLRYKPRVQNYEVGEEIVKQFEQMSLVPTLFFVDPWGYKGLSLRLINSVLKDWGCDCIFFFNYNRINMGLPNDAVDEHMDCLFGKERADALRESLKGLVPAERETAIVEELSQAIRDLGGKYVLPFCFLNDQGTRTSHYLIFVSKHVRGYEIMKEVMAKQSSKADQQVPSFSYCPADRKYPLLFELTRPLDDLEQMLLDEFAGRTMTVRGLFDAHHVGRPYLLKNYKAVLLKLEREGKIRANPAKRKTNTMADHVQVCFFR